jgi:chromosome segregation ATPase
MKDLQKTINETNRIKQDFQELTTAPLSETEQAYLDNIGSRIQEQGDAINKAHADYRQAVAHARGYADYIRPKRERDEAIAKAQAEITRLNASRRYLADCFRGIESQLEETQKNVASLEASVKQAESDLLKASSYDEQEKVNRTLFTLRRELDEKQKELAGLRVQMEITEDPRKTKTRELRAQYTNACKGDICEKLQAVINAVAEALPVLDDMQKFEYVYMETLLTGRDPGNTTGKLMLADRYSEKGKLEAVINKLAILKKEVEKL